MINIFFIAVILTIGIDYLHFDETITSAIKRIMTKGKMSEPFEVKTIYLCHLQHVLVRFGISYHNTNNNTSKRMFDPFNSNFNTSD